MIWKSININIQNIEAQTEKAYLIKMPSNSDYKGYAFWHSSKLIRSGRNSYALELSYTDEFVFKLKKYGNGKTNKYKVIKEKEIDAEDLEDSFGVMNDNIKEKKPKYISEYETHKPKKIEVKEVEVIEELKDDLD